MGREAGVCVRDARYSAVARAAPPLAPAWLASLRQAVAALGKSDLNARTPTSLPSA